MEPPKKELTLDESIAQVMKVLPPVIRNYLAQGKYTAVAKDLMAKYGLRIDQAGVLEREIMLLLMGIENPDEFAQALTEEAKLDQKAISGIAQDINTLIFVPLREEEMKSGAMKAAPAAPSALPIPPRPPVAAPVFGAPPQKPRHLDNRIPPPPPRPVPPVPPAPPRPQNPALRDVLSAVTKSPPMGSSKLLEDHEEPHIEFHTAPQAPRPTPPQNLPGMMPPRPAAPVPQRPPVAPSAGAPIQPRAIAPGARAPFMAPPVAGPSVPPAPPRPVAPVPPMPPRPVPPPAPAMPAQPRPTPPVPTAPAKPYSADPYREPIEP